MRDALLLRRRLQRSLGLLPWAPFLALPMACDDPKTEAISAGPASTSASIASVRTEPSAKKGVAHQATGKWCAASEDVQLVAVRPGPDQLDCPKFIDGSLAVAAKKAPPKGLPGDVRGFLDPPATERKRTDKNFARACCYNWREKAPGGRPLVDGEFGYVATTTSSADWCEGTMGVEAPPPAVRDELAELWLEDALLEHASVASFARASLELLAVGAPADLVEATHRAALDEIRHARACFSIANAYAERGRGPGPLDPLPQRRATLVEVACNTLREGCIGETVAALIARRASESAEDPVIKNVLRGIADDETRHAELAWRVVAWALTRVPTAFEALDTALRAERPSSASGRGPTGLGRYGRLDSAGLRGAIDDAWGLVIDPTFRSLATAAPL